jgi:hypothetical protein
MKLPDGTHYYRKGASWADGTATVTIDERQAASVVGRTVLAYFTVTASAGAVHNFTLCNSGFANVGIKALRIYDNRIEGIDSNDDTGTASGITFDNKYWVMTQVIAV